MHPSVIRQAEVCRPCKGLGVLAGASRETATGSLVALRRCSRCEGHGVTLVQAQGERDLLRADSVPTF